MLKISAVDDYHQNSYQITATTEFQSCLSMIAPEDRWTFLDNKPHCHMGNGDDTQSND